MIFTDRAPIEKVRRLADGRIAAVAKFARSGIYLYTGAEVGRPDLATVRVTMRALPRLLPTERASHCEREALDRCRRRKSIVARTLFGRNSRLG